jgi:hypothetical protein
MQTEDQRVWGERLLTEYSKLPSTASVEARPAMTQLMIMAQRRLTQSLPLTDVLATFAILSGPNTADQSARSPQAACCRNADVVTD